MVDALASGASSRKGVEVRVFSWAPPIPRNTERDPCAGSQVARGGRSRALPDHAARDRPPPRALGTSDDFVFQRVQAFGTVRPILAGNPAKNHSRQSPRRPDVTRTRETIATLRAIVQRSWRIRNPTGQSSPIHRVAHERFFCGERRNSVVSGARGARVARARHDIRFGMEFATHFDVAYALRCL